MQENVLVFSRLFLHLTMLTPGKDAYVLEKKLFMDLEKRVHGVSTNHSPVWTIFSHVRKKVFIYSLRC
jgi:hypothetical protein